MASDSFNFEPSVRRLVASVTDGRAKNVRYRQNELQNLHAILSKNPDAICSAIAKDTQGAPFEVESEFFWAMDAIRTAYESISFEAELTEEYLVASGKDDKNRRIGVGVVTIRPTSHTRLYSIVSPLATAIAAGNCILLELEPTTLAIDPVLRDLLTQSLDQETFSIVTKQIPLNELSQHLIVDQIGTTEPQIAKANEILSSNEARSIAIVDRTADVESAAQAIVGARFNFQGISPYAPDLVLVNEFVHPQFFDACTRFASQFFAEGAGRKPVRPSNATEATKKAIKKAEAEDKVSTFGSSEFTIVDIKDRSSPIANMKIAGKYLAITRTSSLTDSVFLSEPCPTFLAGYFFGSLEAVKFMGQYVDCHVSFVNQIPPQLLFGPAASISLPAAFPHRYDRAMFSVARPQFTSPACDVSSPLSQIITSRAKSTVEKTTIQHMRALAITPMKPTGQGKGEAIGFFEQGLLTGAAVLLSVIVPTVIYGGYRLVRSGWNVWSARR